MAGLGKPDDDDDARGKHRKPCGHCNGTGQVAEFLDNKEVQVTCPLCKGTGLAT